MSSYEKRQEERREIGAEFLQALEEELGRHCELEKCEVAQAAHAFFAGADAALRILNFRGEASQAATLQRICVLMDARKKGPH